MTETPKPAKQLDAEISQLLSHTDAAPYWPGGDGGGGSQRRRSGGTVVVKPHTRTSATCTRCSQFHTTAEHARHAASGQPTKTKGAKGKAKKVKAKKVTKAKATKATKATKTRKSASKARSTKAKARIAQASPSTYPAQASRPAAPSAPISNADLAARIRSAIPRIGPEGRFGRKVFISDIWNKLAPTLPIGNEEFKDRLWDLNREGRIVLARADLVGAMDPVRVRASEITDRGATFHFVLDPSQV